MTLTDIREYLSKAGSASLKEITAHFKAEPALVESMLDQWILKGRVVARQKDIFSTACCGKCGGAGHIQYEWIG